jgi:hypothetical protein
MRYETTTKRQPDEALALARQFFGGELGLREAESGESAATFEGGGVAVRATVGKNGTTVEVVAREWDHQAREFLARLHERS